jgi:hypothetical protein
MMLTPPSASVGGHLLNGHVMYTVINRIPVPASDPSAFEGVVESYETVADLRGDGRDA